MGSPRTRARGTVLVASLVFEIIAALFLTAGFFGPGWICETKKQTGLWYSVDYNEDSSGVVKFADIAGKLWVKFAFNRPIPFLVVVVVYIVLFTCIYLFLVWCPLPPCKIFILGLFEPVFNK